VAMRVLCGELVPFFCRRIYEISDRILTDQATYIVCGGCQAAGINLRRTCNWEG
jgi:hypothetical protein